MVFPTATGNAIVARVARLGAGAPLSLGASTSDELLGTPEIRTPAFRRSARARGIVRPVAATSVPAGGVVRVLPRERNHDLRSARACALPTHRAASRRLVRLLKIRERGSVARDQRCAGGERLWANAIVRSTSGRSGSPRSLRLLHSPGPRRAREQKQSRRLRAADNGTDGARSIGRSHSAIAASTRCRRRSRRCTPTIPGRLQLATASGARGGATRA